jgi:hypothetical protein
MALTEISQIRAVQPAGSPHPVDPIRYSSRLPDLFQRNTGFESRQYVPTFITAGAIDPSDNQYSGLADGPPPSGSPSRCHPTPTRSLKPTQGPHVADRSDPGSPCTASQARLPPPSGKSRPWHDEPPWPDLDQLLPQRCQGPVLHVTGQRQAKSRLYVPKTVIIRSSLVRITASVAVFWVEPIRAGDGQRGAATRGRRLALQ